MAGTRLGEEGRLAGRRSIDGEVLVADDDAAALELLRVSLSEAGYGTCLASTGDEAIGFVADRTIGAAVLDVNLPGRSGYEVCSELRRLYGRALPILFISGERTEPYDRVGGMMLGADDYLVKPFDPCELLRRLDGLVLRAHAAAPRRLTPRERETLTLLAQGFTQGEIADRLEISPKTVATHI